MTRRVVYPGGYDPPYYYPVYPPVLTLGTPPSAHHWVHCSTGADVRAVTALGATVRKSLGGRGNDPQSYPCCP